MHILQKQIKISYHKYKKFQKKIVLFGNRTQ